MQHKFNAHQNIFFVMLLICRINGFPDFRLYLFVECEIENLYSSCNITSTYAVGVSKSFYWKLTIKCTVMTS